MVRISCEDLGCCKAIIGADTDDGLVKKVLEHTQSKHPDKFYSMTPEQEAQLREYISIFAQDI